MIRALVFAAVALCASAFVSHVPSGARMHSRALKMSFDDEAGVTAPLGFWDPLGFTKDLTPDSPTYKKYRIAELKHGRVAMLAVLGYATAQVHFGQTDGFYEGVPVGIDAIKAVPPAGLAQLFAAAGLLEFTLFAQKDDKEAGDVQPESWIKVYSDEDGKKETQNKELNNGRLAQLAIIAEIVQDSLTDAPFPGYGAF